MRCYMISIIFLCISLLFCLFYRLSFVIFPLLRLILINVLSMNPQSIVRDGTGDEENWGGLQHQLQIGMHVLGLQRHQDTNYQQDIKDLQKQLDTKETELTDLKKRVKELEKKDNDHEFQLEKKCDEVKVLKERINELETEKTTLQEELSSVKFSLNNMKEEVKKLSKSKEDQEIKNNTLEGKMRNVESSLKEVEEELETTRKQSERREQKLQSDIAQLRNQQRYVQGAPPMPRLSVQANEQQFAMSKLSGLSCGVQNALYEKVLPNEYMPLLSYTIEQLENDIQKLPMADEDREKARSRWEKLKTELNLNDGTSQVLRSLREIRNVAECQTEFLNEEIVRECTKYLEKENLLKGWLTMERITELFEIWKKVK